MPWVPSAKRKKRQQEWPAIDSARDIDAVRWQVWIGVRLREWRKAAPFGRGRGMTQQQAAQRLGLRQEALSRAESGRRRVDAYELLVFARAYQRQAADLAELFSPPSPEEWARVRRRFTDDPRVHEAPTGLTHAVGTRPRPST